MTRSARTRLLAGAPNEEHFGFSQGLRQDGFVAVSGQVGKDNSTGEMIGPTSFPNRIAVTMRNIRAIAEQLGGPAMRLVYVQAHVAVPLAPVWEQLAAEWRSSFGADPPAVSVVTVDGLSRPDYLVEVSAMATTEPVTVLDDDGPIGAALGSARAVRVGDQVFLSGLLPLDASGALVGETVAEQFDAALNALQETLAELDVPIADVFVAYFWIAERPTPEGFEALAAVNRRFFGESKPTSTLVFVPELPFGALVQVTAVAVVQHPEEELTDMTTIAPDGA